jgi:hypothetical protein
MAGIAFAVLQAVVKQLTHPMTLHHRLTLLALFAPLLAFLWWTCARDHVRTQEAHLARAGALAFYRDTVERSIRRVKRSLWLVPLLLAMLWLDWGAEDPEIRMVTMIFSPLYLAIIAWSYFVRLPRLRREREELR